MIYEGIFGPLIKILQKEPSDFPASNVLCIMMTYWELYQREKMVSECFRLLSLKFSDFVSVNTLLDCVP